MLQMIDKPSRPEWAQPKFWAPFVVVGEPAKNWLCYAHLRSLTGLRLPQRGTNELDISFPSG
jgi:hypothetical protein